MKHLPFTFSPLGEAIASLQPREQGIKHHLERDCLKLSAAAKTTRAVIADLEKRPHDIR